MDTKTLKVEIRKVLGRKVKHLRQKGILPGNIYGKKIKSQAIQVSQKEFEKIYKLVGETGLFKLKIGDSEKPVLIHNVQRHPVTDQFLHVDFLQVDLKEKVVAKVPVELVGESPAEKQGLGTVVLMFNEIEVEALPADLPEKFEIDKSALTEVEQTILVKDLKVDKSKVDIKANEDEIVVKVEPPQKEEIVEKPTPEAPIEGETPQTESSEISGAEQPQAEAKDN